MKGKSAEVTTDPGMVYFGRSRSDTAGAKFANAKNQEREARERERTLKEELKVCKRRSKENLAVAIKKLGKTYAEIADKFHSSPSVVHGWVNKGKPSFENLVELSLRTGYSTDWLCGFEVPSDRTRRERIGDLRKNLYLHLKADLRKEGYKEGELDRFLPEELEVWDFLLSTCRARMVNEQDVTIKDSTRYLKEKASEALKSNLSQEEEFATYRLIHVLDSEKDWLRHARDSPLKDIFFNKDLPAQLHECVNYTMYYKIDPLQDTSVFDEREWDDDTMQS